MSRTLRTALALGAVFFALVLAACGDSVSDNDVVKVGDTTIAKSTFQHWLVVAARATQQSAGGKVELPDPPGFTKCVARLKASAPKPVKGQPKPTDAQFKTQCKAQYEQQVNQVMTYLIRSQWLESEAERQGVKVSDAEAKAAFDKARRQAFPTTADYAKFLKSSGQAEADLLLRQRTQLIEQKITAKLTKDAGKVTDKDIKAYFDKNKAQFTSPESRDLSVVLTKDKATAEKAKAEIEGGASWEKVSDKYTIDPAGKSNGGALDGLQKGQGSPTYDKAVFSAKKGVITGPFKTADGWYVIRVDRIVPKKVAPLNSQTKQAIKGAVAQEKQQKTLNDFGKAYTDRWRAETTCQKGYVVPDCANSKSKPASTVPPGAIPQQQAPPQGAPPQGTATQPGG